MAICVKQVNIWKPNFLGWVIIGDKHQSSKEYIDEVTCRNCAHYLTRKEWFKRYSKGKCSVDWRIPFAEPFKKSPMIGSSMTRFWVKARLQRCRPLLTAVTWLSSNFFWKKGHERQRYERVMEVQTASTWALKRISVTEFQRAYGVWKTRGYWFIDAQGCYLVTKLSVINNFFSEITPDTFRMHPVHVFPAAFMIYYSWNNICLILKIKSWESTFPLVYYVGALPLGE